MQAFDDRLKEMGITPSRRVFVKVLPAYDCTNKDEFYSKLGAGILNLDNLEKILRQNSARKILKFWSLFLDEEGDPDDENIENGDEQNIGEKKLVVGAETDVEPQFVIAECCKPIPGDQVIGYRDPETGRIFVHKNTCDELTRLGAQYGKNIVKEEIKWSQHKAVSYLSSIELRGIDRIGIILELAQLIKDEFNINIREIHIQSHDGIFEGNISLYVRHIQDLNSLMDKIRMIKGIEVVKRNLN
jgi:GTP pyrophosphokinase